MISESLEPLIEEIKKFNGFRFPEEVRNAASEASQPKLLKSIQIPITSSNSPIIKAITAIYQSKKQQQSLQALSVIICDLVSSGFFSNQALSTVVKQLETQTSTTDVDFSLKLIQFASGILPKYSSNLHLIKSLLSIVLSFIDSKNEIVTNSSFAAFQQMISVEFKFIETSKMEDLSPENQQNLKILVKNGIAAKFDDPLHVIAFLIINDLGNLTIGKPIMWLRLPNIPQQTLVRLWDSIITNQHMFLKKSQHIMRVVENSALSQPQSFESLSLHCSFISCFYKELKTSVTSLLEKYLEGMEEGTEYFINSLLLFRTLLIREPLFLSYISDNTDLILMLLKKVNDIIKVDEYNTACEIKLQAGLQKEELIPQYKVELAFLCINSLTRKHTVNLEKLWNILVILLIKILRLCDKPSVELVFRSYSSLLSALSDEKYTQGRNVLIRILCSLVSQQKIFRKEIDLLEETANNLLHTQKSGFLFKIKRLFAYHLLTKLVSTNPEYFKSLYKRVFNTLNLFDNAKLESGWTKSLKDESLAALSKDLCVPLKFSLRFLSQVFIENKDRFDIMWDSISHEIPLLIQKTEVEGEVLDFLETISTELFTDENEEKILKTIADSLNKDSDISLDARLGLIEMISTIVKHNGLSITKGWTHIITAISVENTMNEKNILTSAFMILNTICTDHLQKLSEDDLSRVISIIMSFCEQQIDLNTALTALGLNWNIISLVYNSSKYWKLILSSMMKLFNDKRDDVSSGALSTFFMLLTSNSQQMPEDVYHHLLETCLIPLLLSYETFPVDTLDVTQHALCEICHCACSFWQQFIVITSFRATFWPLLIQKQHSFIAHCNNQDIATNALQFYEDCLPSSVLPYDLRLEILKSVADVISLLLKRESPKSLVISEVGKLIQRTLPTQKEFMTVEMFKIWSTTITEVCLTLPSDNFVNINAQKCLEALLQLLPLNEELLHELVLSVSQIAQKTTKKLLFNAIMQCLTKGIGLVDKSQYLTFLSSCSPLFQISESTELLKNIIGKIEKNSENGKNEETRDLFRTLIIVKKNASDIADFIDSKLVDLILFVPIEDQKEYIMSNVNKPGVLLTLWAKYCDKEHSENHSEEFTNSCFDYILQALTPSIESGNMRVIEFIEMAKVTRQDFGVLKGCNRWHIHYYTHSITKLLNNDKEEVVNAAKRMLKIVTEDLTKIC